MAPVRVGLIGCGAVVQNNYARALPEVRGVTVTAVHDLDARSASAASGIFHAPALSFDELCDRVDAVVVATPPSTHLAIVTACLERGLTVICEKPFVSRAEDARLLTELSVSRLAPLYVGHLRRTFPSARLARDFIATGVFGRVTGLSLVEGGRFAWDTSSNYVDSDVSGGVLFDTGSHTVDLGLFVSGLDLTTFEVAVDHVARDRAEPAHEISARVRLRLPDSEVKVEFHLSRHRVLANRVRVVLEHGVVDVSVGPRDRIRVTGPRGTAILPTRAGAVDFNGYFTEQFVQILVERRGEEFEASRFIGLTAILEQVAATEGPL